MTAAHHPDADSVVLVIVLDAGLLLVIVLVLVFALEPPVMTRRIAMVIMQAIYHPLVWCRRRK